MKNTAFYLLLILGFITSGCVRIPNDIQAVSGFKLERYLGSWYEIARLDHSFERGLNNISATYTARDDGGISVINKGFDEGKGVWKEAKGKAYFVARPDIGRLKVSFFGPFYGGYNIIALDKKNYSYSMVCGPDRSYLWILARNMKLEQNILSELIEKAEGLGFKTENLIYVDHN